MSSINNVSIKTQKDCCGCALCASICAKDAITMQSDALGFKYPVVNIEKCTNCGLCIKKCAFEKPISNRDFEQEYHALRHSNETELLKSQSGAAFVILSDAILEKGGVVYGAAFDNEFHVIHKRATSSEEREELRYSKYTQSNIERCYKEIVNDLKNGLIVLFTGTPCQVAAVKSFVPIRLHDNLYLVDIICHGVPSPQIWSDYLKYIENKYGKIKRAYFRDKRIGWNVQKETFINAQGKERSFITYKKLFYSHICLRHSCFNCQFTNYDRCSDITISDFWGWEKISDKFKDNKGMSLCIINTDKGKEFFNSAKKVHFTQEVAKEDCVQPQLVQPAKYNPNREKFEEDYKKHDFLYIAKKYSDLNFKMQLKYKLRKLKQKLTGK